MRLSVYRTGDVESSRASRLRRLIGTAQPRGSNERSVDRVVDDIFHVAGRNGPVLLTVTALRRTYK